ncbi:MAG: hypothetical protein J3K34DRAFT_497224, partial [Monoraphidium minutum]
RAALLGLFHTLHCGCFRPACSHPSTPHVRAPARQLAPPGRTSPAAPRGRQPLTALYTASGPTRPRNRGRSRTAMAAAAAAGAHRGTAAARRRPLLLLALLLAAAARLPPAAARLTRVDIRNTCWNAINVSVFFSDASRNGLWRARSGYVTAPNQYQFGQTYGTYFFVYAESWDPKVGKKWAGRDYCWNVWGRRVCGRKVYIGSDDKSFRYDIRCPGRGLL